MKVWVYDILGGIFCSSIWGMEVCAKAHILIISLAAILAGFNFGLAFLMYFIEGKSS